MLKAESAVSLLEGGGTFRKWGPEGGPDGSLRAALEGDVEILNPL